MVRNGLLALVIMSMALALGCEGAKSVDDPAKAPPALRAPRETSLFLTIIYNKTPAEFKVYGPYPDPKDTDGNTVIFGDTIVWKINYTGTVPADVTLGNFCGRDNVAPDFTCKPYLTDLFQETADTLSKLNSKITLTMAGNSTIIKAKPGQTYYKGDFRYEIEVKIPDTGYKINLHPRIIISG